MSVFKQFREYRRLVDMKSEEFSEWMVSYLKERPEFQVVLQDAESDPRKKQDLIFRMFKCWIQDPDSMDWFFRHEMIEKGL